MLEDSEPNCELVQHEYDLFQRDLEDFLNGLIGHYGKTAAYEGYLEDHCIE